MFLFYCSIGVVREVNNVIVAIRSFLPPTVSKNALFYADNIATRMKFIAGNTGRVNCSSCISKTVVLNYL